MAGVRNGYANAIAVTNVAVASVEGGTADISFDIQWENSWKLSWSDDGGATTVMNWDAAWVFLKFRTASGYWQHALLTADGHTATSNMVIDVGSNGTNGSVGVFIRRETDGSGTFGGEGVRVRWDFAKSGLGGTTDVDIAVHAIEMVYIPEGAFALGSGGSESGHFYEYPVSSQPYYVNSEAAILHGTSSGFLCNTYGGSFTIPAEFPKGFAAFYCMKYEITQGQYASYLNHLTPDTAAVRYPAFYGSSRHTIECVDNVYRADAPDRACNYLSVQDLCSYLAWAGLRPMTELEFEKTCRGTMLPEPNEYPWGSTTATRMTGFVGTDGSGHETALPETANYHTYDGPVRVGIFAEPGASRQKSGAGYYGVMNLYGNVSETVVCATLTRGRDFIPVHGDGSGIIPLEYWPAYDGFMRRTAMTSNRSTGTSSSREYHFGGRGVRTGP